MTAPWPTHPLGDLVENLDRQRVPVSATERAKRRGSIPYYGATGQVGTIDAPLFAEDLVLLGEDGVQFFDPTKPKAYLISGPSWVNNHAHVLRPRMDRLDRRFLMHFLNQCDYRGFANGTTRLKLTQAAMNRIPVPLPPLDEQRRIVNILEDHLSRLDAADQMLRTVDTRAQQLLETWLARAAASAASAHRPLGDLLREPVRNGISARASKDGTGVRTLTLTAVTKRNFSEENTKLTVAEPRRVHDLWLRSGDVFIERANTPELVGTAALYRGPEQWATFPDLLIRVRVDESLLSPEYLDLILRSPAARRWFRQRAKGLAGSMPKIDHATVESLPVPIRSIGEQTRLCDEFGEIRSHAMRLEQASTWGIRRGAALRRSLLQAAFSGQLTRESVSV